MFAHSQSLDSLIEQLQCESGFQFHNNRGFITPQRHHVTALYLRLHGVALRLQVALHGQVEIGLRHGR